MLFAKLIMYVVSLAPQNTERLRKAVLPVLQSLLNFKFYKKSFFCITY